MIELDPARIYGMWFLWGLQGLIINGIITFFVITIRKMVRGIV